jgi:hypothetical protein
MGAPRPLLAAALAALLAAGGVLAWFAPGWASVGPAPRYSAPTVPPTGAGSGQVQLSDDARRHPSGEAVRAQLQRHYDAINAGDHAAWSATVVPARAAGQPEPGWLAAYDTTIDGSIRVDRIDDLDGGRVLVRVRFVSTQDPTDAPPELQVRRICWRSSLPMSGSPPVVELAPAGGSIRRPC